MTSKVMGVCEFGRALLDSGDLDPLYTMIYRARLSRPDLARYLLAYWCFYNTGTCSRIVDQGDYWAAMREAAADSVHPRGGDRRHFRGNLATSTVEGLRGLGMPPEEILDWMCFDGQAVGLRHVMLRVRTLRGFGPTIAFKVADMLERLWKARYRFVGSEATDPLLMSDTPRAGAAAAYPDLHEDDAAVRADALLRTELAGYEVPPRYDRGVTVLETETVLCKWKHYLGGSYYVGKGRRAQLDGLLRYRGSPTAQRMLRAGVAEGLWVAAGESYTVPSCPAVSSGEPPGRPKARGAVRGS